MAEPKKETVRIALPPRPEHASAASGEAKRDTARIVLPSRAPVSGPRLPPKIAPVAKSEQVAEPSALPLRRPPVISPSSKLSSPLLQPLPKPPGPPQQSPSSGLLRPTPIREENGSPPSTNGGPKKETARISVLPRPTPQALPAINMTKTQPLLFHPPTGITSAPAVITSRPLPRVEPIPRSLCWALFAVSTVIFLIQIWNYVVS